MVEKAVHYKALWLYFKNKMGRTYSAQWKIRNQRKKLDRYLNKRQNFGNKIVDQGINMILILK
jgi:hypothetical protein